MKKSATKNAIQGQQNIAQKVRVSHALYAMLKHFVAYYNTPMMPVNFSDIARKAQIRHARLKPGKIHIMGKLAKGDGHVLTLFCAPDTPKNLREKLVWYMGQFDTRTPKPPPPKPLYREGVDYLVESRED